MAAPTGFFRRTGAYLVDIVPITVLTFGVFVVFFGVDDLLRLRISHPEDKEIRTHFLIWRNYVRDSAFLIWVVYSAITEATRMQGTFGKKLFGLRVTDMEGKPLSVGRSVSRNLFKIVSLIPLGLGFFWAAFRKDKRTWHDLVAKTQVVRVA